MIYNLLDKILKVYVKVMLIIIKYTHVINYILYTMGIIINLLGNSLYVNKYFYILFIFIATTKKKIITVVSILFLLKLM